MAYRKLRGAVLAASLATSAIAALAPANALTINLRDIGGVTGSPAQQGFAIAARYWESVLTNSAVVNINVGFSDLGPSVLGSTGSELREFVPISSYYDALRSTGNSALDRTAVANLSPLSATGSVAVTVPEYLNTTTKNGAALTGTRQAPDGQPISNRIALSTANNKALFGGNENAVDAEIQFSSRFAFDFNPTDGVGSDAIDFIGVAIHEIGHALGFISGADDFDYVAGESTPNIDDSWWGYGLDMFRYSADDKLDWTFDTPSYFSIDGGATAYQDGFFSTGAFNGDGNQASHWKQPASGGCTGFRGIMNPYICNGTVDSITGLDLAAMDAIGWNLSAGARDNAGYRFSTADAYRQFAGAAVPEPSTWVQMLFGFAMLGGALRYRRRKTAVGFA